ncbi:excinuclease ABC subunit UvrC [Candidatus Woesearchaeota archaeon]|nr:MAG: excinuclease ABC subunit UvrC [Candidatus Woesearchaeota archaeon]
MIPLKNIPLEPGCYLFKNKEGNIIYVGKAKKLRQRVRQYFDRSPKTPKTQFLVSQIADIDYIVVGNEVEALLLENKLIKQHKPKYNVLLKDAKTYAYLKLTDEQYPRLISTRSVDKKGEFFGPFTDGSARNELRRLALKLFKLRTCRTLPKKACLNYHIGLCTAPCIGRVSQSDYAQQVEGARAFLRGDVKDVVKKLRLEMKQASDKLLFEQALEKKRQIEAIEHLQEKQAVDTLKRFDQDVVVMEEFDTIAVFSLLSVNKGVISKRQDFRFEMQDDVFESFLKLYYSQNYIPQEIIVNRKVEDPSIEKYLQRIKGAKVTLTRPQRGEKLRLMQLALANIRKEDKRLLELQEALNLADVPRIIECFDISNYGDEVVVAGMTRWVDAKPDRSNYRRFEIKTNKQDDFAAMREAVYRRYSRLREENVRMPDLILIDGGKGQLNAALWSLEQLGLQIPLIALAKKNEEIFIPHEDEPLRFDKNSEMMLLLRSMRDSVHRFSISYSRLKKRKKVTE